MVSQSELQKRNLMARALIIVGGAIDRGFVPWVLDKFEIDILDVSPNLVNEIAS